MDGVLYEYCFTMFLLENARSKVNSEIRLSLRNSGKPNFQEKKHTRNIA